MAITAPTPPTPPTAPVVPGARSSTSDASGNDTTQQNSSTAGATGDKGIHINISLPDKDSSQQERDNAANVDNTGKMGTTKKTTGSQDKSQASQQEGDDGAAKTAQQARQDMVQQALGNDDASSQQEQQEVSQQPWPLPGNNLGSMSYMPFLIVFVAAFITFMLKNMSKKPSKPTVRMIARKERERHISNKTNGSAAIKASSDKDSKKGSHFEMRI